MSEPTPRCPFCNHKSVIPDGHCNWYCNHCRATFDGVDDGDVGYGPPSRRIERQERNNLQRKVRR